MAENENIAEVQAENPAEVETVISPEPENKPSKWPAIKAGIKEWIRKRLVALKRKTNIIPLLLFLLSSLIYLFSLAAFSQAGLKDYRNGDMLGLPVFVNCLLAILIVVVHMNAFPKRSKKINLLNYILIYVFAAIMFGMDILYYIKLSAVVEKDGLTLATAASTVQSSATTCIVHMVFLGIAVVALATLPLYSKLIMKINTSKNLEASQLKDVIESEDDE